MHKSFGSKGASTLESSQQLTQWLPDISKGLQHAITAAADTLLLHVQAVATSCLSHLVRQGVQDGPAGCKLVYSSSHCLGKCLQLQLWVSAGVVHFDWTVNCTAASQQVQLRHPTAQVACTAATALSPPPGSQRSKSGKKLQPWHEKFKKEMLYMPRHLKDGEVGGQPVKKGQWVQVRSCMCEMSLHVCRLQMHCCDSAAL